MCFLNRRTSTRRKAKGRPRKRTRNVRRHLFHTSREWCYDAQDPRSILCHPFGDQTYSLWIQATGLNLTQFDDRRIHHSPPAGKTERFFTMRNVCDDYIGIHGAYPNVMPLLWVNSNDSPKRITPVTLLRNNCPNFAEGFDVNKFAGLYRHTPKPCISGSYWGLIPWHSAEKT